MTIKKARIIQFPTRTLWILSCSALSLSAAELPTGWKNVQRLEINQTGLVKISVPLETLTAARRGLEDLRLYDNNGREIPFFLERPVRLQPVVRPAKQFHVTVNPDATVITLETGFTQSLSGLTLQTAAAGFFESGPNRRFAKWS